MFSVDDLDITNDLKDAGDTCCAVPTLLYAKRDLVLFALENYATAAVDVFATLKAENNTFNEYKKIYSTIYRKIEDLPLRITAFEKCFDDKVPAAATKAKESAKNVYNALQEAAKAYNSMISTIVDEPPVDSH